jgi:hypothetical protein
LDHGLAFDGTLPAGPIDIGSSPAGGSITVRPVDYVDRSRWQESGLPLHAPLMSWIGTGFEATWSIDIPGSDAQLPEFQGVDPVALYGRMMLGEVSYAVLQAADLVRLVVEQDMEVAFIETRIKRGPTSYDGPSYIEFRAGLRSVQWSITAAQAGALPTQ